MYKKYNKNDIISNPSVDIFKNSIKPIGDTIMTWDENTLKIGGKKNIKFDLTNFFKKDVKRVNVKVQNGYTIILTSLHGGNIYDSNGGNYNNIKEFTLEMDEDDDWCVFNSKN